MVLIFSLAVFFFVKFSIDWATASKTELNKLKDQKLREITDALITKEFLKEEEYMAEFKPYQILSTQLDTFPIKQGQFILTTECVILWNW